MAFTLHIDARAVEHLEGLGEDARELIKDKTKMAVENPFRNKRLTYPGRHLFSVKFTDRRKAKRLIYEVVDQRVIIRCIIERENGYRNLDRYL